MLDAGTAAGAAGFGGAPSPMKSNSESSFSVHKELRAAREERSPCVCRFPRHRALTSGVTFSLA